MSEAAPIIRGEKIWLRGYREEDLPVYEQFVTTQDAQWAGYSVPLSKDAIRDFYDKRLRGGHGSDEHFFVVCPLGSDEFIGTTWLWNFDSRLGGPEFSIFMHGPTRWGRGLGTDAINATLDYAYGFTEVDRIWLSTMAINERGQRSFEKAGFSREGVVRHYEIYRGKPMDAVLMSILRADWEALDRPRSWELGENPERES
jgi:RimJ/RimL family protein N-acetyltransferase